MNDVILREATAADASTIAAVIRAAFEEHRGQLDPPSGAHGETTETVCRKLATATAVLALLDGVAVGCAFYQEEPERMYLSRLSVLPVQRCRGIARALIAFVEGRARMRGLARVYLGVRVALSRQRAYYERLGYLPIGGVSHPGYSQPTYVLMEKHLPRE